MRQFCTTLHGRAFTGRNLSGDNWIIKHDNFGPHLGRVLNSEEQNKQIVDGIEVKIK